MLFRWGRRQLEVWLCPAGEQIDPHVHSSIDSTIRLLWGCMQGQIADKKGWVTAWSMWQKHDFFRPFTIPAGVKHSASIAEFTIFLNWENWRGEMPITSAAEDFTAV